MIQDFLKLLSESWQNRPAVVILCGVAMAILVFVILDTHRHRRRQKKRRPDKHHH